MSAIHYPATFQISRKTRKSKKVYPLALLFSTESDQKSVKDPWWMDTWTICQVIPKSSCIWFSLTFTWVNLLLSVLRSSFHSSVVHNSSHATLALMLCHVCPEVYQERYYKRHTSGWYPRLLNWRSHANHINIFLQRILLFACSDQICAFHHTKKGNQAHPISKV